ncbi:hypothetical protein Tco_0661078 [Tanacetum coccineum]
MQSSTSPAVELGAPLVNGIYRMYSRVPTGRVCADLHREKELDRRMEENFTIIGALTARQDVSTLDVLEVPQDLDRALFGIRMVILSPIIMLSEDKDVAVLQIDAPKDKLRPRPVGVQWVNRVKLKGRSVWDIDIDTNDSWGWKKFMELRSKMKPHVFHKIGNGEITSVWYDKWNLCGPLSNFIYRRDIYDARFSDNDCVANLIEDGRWKWPNEWFVKFPLLKSIEVPSINDRYDQSVWLNNKGKLKEFAIKDVWLDLRCQYSKVDCVTPPKSDDSGIVILGCDFKAQSTSHKKRL